MKSVKRWFQFLYHNFAPVLVFVAANRWWSYKIAVGVALTFTFFEIIRHRYQNKNMTSFFKISAAMAVVLGVLDLLIQDALFFKFEASLSNLVMAIFFGISLRGEKSLIQQFAEEQGRTSSEPSEDKNFFFRLLTMIWVAYFVMKAGLYLWINFNFEIADASLMRMFIGNVSFGVMIFLSMGLAKPLWRILERFRIFPSMRESYIGSNGS